MAPSTSTRRTVGFISTWAVYKGTTIDRHAHALMQGICAAARDNGCRLLLAAGVSPMAERGEWRTVWPVPSEDTEFVPVGPWNTDGLIIVPDDVSDAQSRYVHDLQASGFPVVFTTPEAPGPMVVVDNANGIGEAVRHLVGHGHRRIAFIAGKQHRRGDSAERLEAYLRGLVEEGLEADERLVAYGEHRFDGGQAAMRKLLGTGVDFTAFIASNDLSCLGAIDILRECGRSVPDDVAAIGFDDILDARSHRPSLTTVRHPTFALGYESVLALLARIDGRPASSSVVVPTRLIVRESCGCRRDQAGQVAAEVAAEVAADAAREERHGDAGEELASLARQMAEAAFSEARHSTLDQLEEQCQRIVAALAASVDDGDERPLHEEVARLLARTEERAEDPHVWQSAISALYRRSTVLLALAGRDRQGWLIGLLDHARLEVSEQVQRQTTRALLEHMDMMTELGLLTARLPSALELAESTAILAEHLPRLGVERFLVATYVDDEEDPGATSEVLLSTGLGGDRRGLRFPSREFPPSGLYPDDEPLQLILLPLRVDDRTTGFVALSTTNLEPPAAIVSNLATAIRGGRLYREAVDGRRLAEEANQLKGRFLSMVSHELRTPLSVVVGLSDMVVREARQTGSSSSGIVRDLERMAASAEHLGRLIGDVLDLASSEAGQLRLVRHPLRLSDVLATTVLAGEQMARDKGLEWHASLPAEDVWVMGDRTRLRQIVLNLVGNAVKFTNEGTVSLDVARDGETVTIAVSDTGCGIPPDEQPLIFDEFHRAGYTAGSRPGLGLGLAISRQLAEHHGGRLEVHSPGRGGLGSTFVFSLPALAPAVALGQPDSDRRVVVVETANEPSGAMEPAASASLPERDPLLARRLRDRGYRVDVERAGLDVDWVATILERGPGAIIVDETLASGPAWELNRLLRRQPGGADVPVLAYRLHDDGRGAVLELNYLSKPLHPSALADELIRQVGPATDARTPRILVVDDDPDILDLHARVVREAGGEPIEARTGREALAALGETRPDLVLLDLGMPDMDGFDLLEAMRARTATQGIPVIVITGQVLTDEDLERLNRGVATILSKGVFTVDETIGRIESALAGRRGLGSATQRLVRRAIVFVDGHFAESIGRDDIARHVSISPDYLTDCFHQELGITPIAYLNRRRLREARDLLDRNDDPITTVAMTVGFSDVSHFTRTFHREVGVSPRAYRRGRRS
jgi:signal transduction histidine kinase/DNA-binding LacI/PurR family transcriptional regulator/DNA-binding response OmpR family regulator